MRLFILSLIISNLGYAQDSLKRLEDELNFLRDREVFLYLPKKDILLEKSDEVKTSSSAILKISTEESKNELLEEMEEDLGFSELPINAPETN